MIFSEFLNKNDALDRLFVNKVKVIGKDPPQVQNFVLQLYRGFDADMESMEGEDQSYVLSPKRSEQGLIWFTHQFTKITGSPIQYAASHGSLFLTYPLQCCRHVQTVHWSDGSTHTAIPDEILQQTKQTENCRFHMGIELPDGWVFSYKVEKFVGCSMKLRISQGMLCRSDEILQNGGG